MQFSLVILHRGDETRNCTQMKRRNFLQKSGTVAIGVRAFGTISLAGDNFTADTPTTSDILGPYYRPGAPFRKNLNPVNFGSEVLHLKGTVFREDGKTPVPHAVIEAWQCQADGFYDNLSQEYLYRGAQKIKENGQYHFITTQPVPEPVDETRSILRPAHIHLRISSIGEQDLITQIYFTGDAYLDSDPSTKAERVTKRILSVKKTGDRESEILFDIVLKKQELPPDGSFEKVSGLYKMSDNSIMEFYRDGDLLFYKTNNQIWGGLSFNGNNTFVGGAQDTEAIFDLLPGEMANVKFRFVRRRTLDLEGKKFLRYPEK